MTIIQFVLYVYLSLISSGYSQSIDYDCQDFENITQAHVFYSLEDYKNSDFPFKTNNWITISSKLPRLQANSFMTKDSNYIRKIILSAKDISTIEVGAFNSLYCLKNLMLQNNHLTDISENTFQGSPKVEELNLSNNELVGIPSKTFNNMNHLLKLDLSFNKIKHLSSDTFASLDNLWELHLEHNSLLDLPSEMFQSMRRLRWLFLGYNRISVITTPSLRYLDELDTLDLSHNGISYIYESMFRTLILVSSLDISGNHLRKLDIRALHISMPKLHKINLNNNSWQCSDLAIMLKEIESYEMGIIISPNVIKFDNLDVYEVGCYNGSDPVVPTPPTTYDPNSGKKFPDDVNFFDDSEILAAIENLKSYVIALIVIIVICTAASILLRKYSWQSLTRRRGTLAFQLSSSDENPSLPLLNR